MINQNIKEVKLYCGNFIIKIKKPNVLGSSFIAPKTKFAINVRKVSIKARVKRYIVNDNLTSYIEYNKEVSVLRKVISVKKIPVLQKDNSFDLPLEKIEVIQK